MAAHEITGGVRQGGAGSGLGTEKEPGRFPFGLFGSGCNSLERHAMLDESAALR